MENYVKLSGVLDGVNKFNDKVGNARVSVVSESNGQVFRNKFSMTVFQPTLSQLSEVPVGSLVVLEGRLKNSSYERDGTTTWKLEVLCNGFKVTKPAEAGKQVTDIPF